MDKTEQNGKNRTLLGVDIIGEKKVFKNAADSKKKNV